MTFTYASYSHIGMRSNNEDACSIHGDQDTLIAVVADGVGGQVNGEIASAIAAERIPLYLADSQFDEDELAYAILKAHEAICATRSGACTTVTALWIQGNKAIAAHAGDSRIYQFRGGKILFQSEDHSLVQVEISLGRLPEDACRNHRDRNKVYRVLGDEKERPRLDIQELDVRPGDRFLLCSDGFWEPVTEEIMLLCMAESSDAADWLEAMSGYVAKANDPKQDNHTAAAISVCL